FISKTPARTPKTDPASRDSSAQYFQPPGDLRPYVGRSRWLPFRRAQAPWGEPSNVWANQYSAWDRARLACRGEGNDTNGAAPKVFVRPSGHQLSWQTIVG